MQSDENFEDDFEDEDMRQIQALFSISQAIVERARDYAMESSGMELAQGINVSIPIMARGSDMRIVIEAGPSVAARNAIDRAMINAGLRPSLYGEKGPSAREAIETLKDAASIISIYVASISTAERNSNATDESSKKWRISASMSSKE